MRLPNTARTLLPRSGQAVGSWCCGTGLNRATGRRRRSTALVELLAARRLRPVIATRLPLAEARRAHEMIGGAEVSGKIVLVN